jgi:hypothetical protein
MNKPDEKKKKKNKHILYAIDGRKKRSQDGRND